MGAEQQDPARSPRQGSAAKSAPMISAWSVGPFAVSDSGALGRRAETPMEHWLSLFPAAQLFGVRWIGWDMLTGLRPTGAARAADAADEDRVARERAVLSMGWSARMNTVATGEERPAPRLRVVETTDVLETAEVGAAKAAEPKTQDVMQDVMQAAAQDAPKTVAAEPSEAALVKPAGLYDAPPAQVDDLKRIRGVGPRLEELLNELGVYTLTQIAEFHDADLLWIDAHLSTFKGRALRDQWVEQAKDLLALDAAQA